MDQRIFLAAGGAFRRLSSIDRREKPALLVVVLLVGIVAAALSARLVDYRGDLDLPVLALMGLWICGNVAGHRGIPTLANIAKGCCTLLTLSMATALTTAALAPVSAPVADALLDGLDQWLFGFSFWPAITAHYAAFPGAVDALCYAYVSIEWQPFALVVALCVLRDFDRLWHFLTAWGVSLLVCACVFPLLPAEGAYGFFHIARTDVPGILIDSAWRTPPTLRAFRSGELHMLDFRALDGLITMPSFHACSAVLLGWGFSRDRLLALPFWALNAAMWASSMPIGGHYGVDIIAGTAIALASLRFGAQAMRWAGAGPAPALACSEPR